MLTKISASAAAWDGFTLLTIYAIQVTDAREIPVAILRAQYHNRF
jgi:hypothetical protein